MIRVNIIKQSNYPVSSPKLKEKLREFFRKRGIVSDAEVSVALVGEERMRELGRRYLRDDNLHDILSFPNEETDEKFVYPPDKIIHLGEIVICYPKALQEARNEEKLIEDRVWELVEHGALHLLGIHHE